MMAALREPVRPIPAGHVPLPTWRLSNPWDMAQLKLVRCGSGCLLSLEDGLYACVTHGLTLGWCMP